MKIVIDTNIVFSSLLSPDGTISDLILNSFESFSFFAPSFLLTELETHQNKLLKLSGFTKSEMAFLKRMVFHKIEFIDVRFIEQKNWTKAMELTKNIDEFDTPFIALSLELKAPLWTGDKKLINGLTKKDIDWILNTNQMIELRNKTDNLYSY